MLLCVVVEPEAGSLVIVTMFKTSKLNKYLEEWES